MLIAAVIDPWVAFSSLIISTGHPYIFFDSEFADKGGNRGCGARTIHESWPSRRGGNASAAIPNAGI